MGTSLLFYLLLLVPPLCTEAQPVEYPCEGLLIPFADAEDILDIKYRIVPELEANLAYEKSTTAEFSRLSAECAERYELDTQLWRVELHKANNPPWYAQPQVAWPTGLALGFIGAGALYYAVK